MTYGALDLTAEEIRTAAHVFNADYPNVAADIDGGEPVLRVNVAWADSFGRRIRFVFEPGIMAPDGGFVGADLGWNVTLPSLDGRLSRAVQVGRRFPLSRARVRVDIREVGR